MVVAGLRQCLHQLLLDRHSAGGQNLSECTANQTVENLTWECATDLYAKRRPKILRSTASPSFTLTDTELGSNLYSRSTEVTKYSPAG